MLFFVACRLCTPGHGEARLLCFLPLPCPQLQHKTQLLNLDNCAQAAAAKFMEDISILCDHRFATLSAEPGGSELISFRYVIANDGLNDLETGSQGKSNANTG